MIRAARFGGWLLMGLLLVGCETTGDPQQGGLFGWSEAKARDRQRERQEQVAKSQEALAREDANARALDTRNASTEQGIAAATQEHERAEAKLRTQKTALLAKIDRLESLSPTPATASHVRTYRRKVNTIAAQTAWTVGQRSDRLRAVEADIDAALAQLAH